MNDGFAPKDGRLNFGEGATDCHNSDSCGQEERMVRESERLLWQESLSLRKKTARQELQAIAQGFSPDYLSEVNRAVCDKILQSRVFACSQVVFGYLAFAGEISVDAVLQEALRLGKTVAVPRILSRTEMQAVCLTSLQDLPLDRYGIRTVKQPVRTVAPSSLELILVPGAGFAFSGCRMGRGAGYYDRFLPRTQGFTLGIACDPLVRESLPYGPYDYKVSALVTESRFLICSSGQSGRRETGLIE